jgi:ribonuclease Z
MIDNCPVRTLHHAGLTIEGYSRAAVQSYWRIPEMSLGFDLGAQPWSFMGTENWFVSHGHLDHIAALPVYVARRRMMKMTPPTIYAPQETVAPIQDLLRSFMKLDRGRMPCELKGLGPGDEVELSRELVVSCSATKHTVPSLGFVVWERRNKLKPEYVGLSGDQIRDLKFSGVAITEELRKPLVAYAGDTAPPGIDACPAMLEAKILIVEMTFASSRHRKEKIHKFGHMHLDDFIERRARFRNEVIIAAHASTRYHADLFERIVRKRLPDMLDGRLQLWL